MKISFQQLFDNDRDHISVLKNELLELENLIKGHFGPKNATTNIFRIKHIKNIFYIEIIFYKLLNLTLKEEFNEDVEFNIYDIIDNAWDESDLKQDKPQFLIMNHALHDDLMGAKTAFKFVLIALLKLIARNSPQQLDLTINQNLTNLEFSFNSI
jgi:hypothetical protein